MKDVVVANRYRLGRRIGSGGMGRVWLARDEVLRRNVAIKEVLLPEGLTEAEAVELRMRTLREARAAARLSHPSVIKIYDVMYAEDRPWIVMEYVESRSLAQVIKEDGPMPPERVANVGLSLLAALCAAHDAGVLHRDVKPGNVLLAVDGRVVLTDFGLATFDDIGTQLTQTGVVHGSPQFIAPERALDGTSSPAADLWSLGATLYAAVEGRAPYSRVSSYATLTALATAPPDPPRRAGPLKPVLGGLLRRNPRSRMAPEEARRRLTEIASIERSRQIPRQRKHDDSEEVHIMRPGRRHGAGGSRADATPIAWSGLAGSEPAGTDSARSQAAGATFVGPGLVGPGLIGPGLIGSGSAGTGFADTDLAGTGFAGVDRAEPVFAGSSFVETGFAEPDFDPDVDTDRQMDLAWALDPADTKAPIGGRTGGNGFGLRRRLSRRSTRWMLAAVGVVVLAGGTSFAIELATAPQRGDDGVAPVAGAASSPATIATVGAVWPCAPTPPDVTVPVPSSIPVNAQFGLQPDWIWYSDPAGYQISVPSVMRLARAGDIACLYDPTTSSVVGIERWYPTSKDPATALKGQISGLRAKGALPGYTSLGITNDTYQPGHAEAEYTYDGPGGRIHAIMRDYLDSSGVAYTLSWATPASNWTIDHPYYPVLETSLIRTRA